MDELFNLNRLYKVVSRPACAIMPSSILIGRCHSGSSLHEFLNSLIDILLVAWFRFESACRSTSLRLSGICFWYLQIPCWRCWTSAFRFPFLYWGISLWEMANFGNWAVFLSSVDEVADSPLIAALEPKLVQAGWRRPTDLVGALPAEVIESRGRVATRQGLCTQGC